MQTETPITDLQRVQRDILNTLEFNANNITSEINKKSRVYFRNQERVPVFGQFVQMKDFKELWNKGMVRIMLEKKIPFVGHGETWTPKEGDTNILTLQEIASIKNF